MPSLPKFLPKFLPRSLPRPPDDLIAQCAHFSRHAPHPALEALRARLLATYGENLLAILYYGSCLRGGDPHDGLVDLYVIVARYEKAHARRLPALLNRLLPPNVFYLETHDGTRTVRCKYALLSQKQFLRCVSPRWFHSYFWARFAQPMGLLHARDADAAQAIHLGQARAVLTFTSRILPRLPRTFTVADVWRQGLRLTYRAELRTEGEQRADEIYARDQAYYQAVTPPALRVLPGVETAGEVCYHASLDDRQRRLARWSWALRIAQGKLLSVLRLLKAFFTFEGGLDYLAWKLERHTGVAIEISPRLRRWPLIFIWPLMWRLYRQGVFR